MECLNGNLGFVVGSLSMIPAGHENILLLYFSAETYEATPPQTATMECMMHPEQIWLDVYLTLTMLLLVHAYYSAVQSITIDHLGTFAFVFTF